MSAVSSIIKFAYGLSTIICMFAATYSPTELTHHLLSKTKETLTYAPIKQRKPKSSFYFASKSNSSAHYGKGICVPLTTTPVTYSTSIGERGEKKISKQSGPIPAPELMNLAINDPAASCGVLGLVQSPQLIE